MVMGLLLHLCIILLVSVLIIAIFHYKTRVHEKVDKNETPNLPYESVDKNKEEDLNLPDQIERILQAIAKSINRAAKTMEDTVNFLTRLANHILDGILNIVRSVIRWISRTIEAVFTFCVRLWRIFWSIRRQILRYASLYIPSLLLWLFKLKLIAKIWTMLVVLLTIIMAFLEIKGQKPRNNQNRFTDQ